jgi:hypothetical protein
MAKEKLIKGRVLVDCSLGKCNDVVQIQEDQVKTLSGVVDTDPGAVAYAESIAVPVLTPILKTE